ncbi:MAG: LL-diaminopimelate aminotransferase [Deltaproteobacteria bacterium]|nr:LL-diaminopimelate aminotransferase [Deltaproteobacteria bacterium]
MAKINLNYGKLSAGYLFPEIARRTNSFIEQNPGTEVIRLGIGNTTEPLTSYVLEGLHKGVDLLSNVATYTGYGDGQGRLKLRELLVDLYAEYGVAIDTSEIFVSDGAKPDAGNIQSIFGIENEIAVQDPAYPVYVDTNVIAGRTGAFNPELGLYEGITYMPCTEENHFFPAPPDKKVDLIYLCNPNNPTGLTATKDQIKIFIDYARAHKSIIIYDAAYAAFIKDSDLPRSVYEIEGADKCCIEINSLSKSAGFTGVRLGWAIVPKNLVAEDTTPGEINKLWNRRQCTFFNGASNIIQQGGIYALSPQGLKESAEMVNYYMENATIIREALIQLGMTVFGGDNSPYIWLKIPNQMDSWEFFNKLLKETRVLGTPGSGFGPSGQGYFRLSAFGHREDVKTAIERIKRNLDI